MALAGTPFKSKTLRKLRAMVSEELGAAAAPFVKRRVEAVNRKYVRLGPEQIDDDTAWALTFCSESAAGRGGWHRRPAIDGSTPAIFVCLAYCFGGSSLRLDRARKQPWAG
jgi:hypothetical protein